ncbi:ABC transporter-like protein [Azorhizobium caulinodans ORS 571]|uniref:ABC transporter-like protein n=1 Tax=Azorhizobium caulinodans (strain ATCC 43989 / DSM 5975 / JCM 20966 / LMG 6465 / NBRC 14845 / NCIMB 13405 / ORS 571) TaxID=438753 RepID=A8HX94_AZOC5|nr:ABC transporter ATP-binding protein/permease [Azorhizobium caulinodans]BAF87473.1 ABC transporter-like protein [Azorhizobium caulinodans ORS 571]
MRALLTLLRDIRRLALPYFRSEERWTAIGLLGAVIGLELAWVYCTVLLNRWNNAFYDAIQEKDFGAFKHQLLIFCAIAAGAICVAVYQIYLKQWLEIRWRRWLTKRYLEHWLGDDTHYRLRLSGDAADNPDQRIAQDVSMFVSQTISVGVGLLGTIVSLTSFSVILWGLSGAIDLKLFGIDMHVPGYLFWAALLYAALGTLITHFIGKPLVRLNFDQQRYEADFRVDMVRVRENSEQIALLGGEPAESRKLEGRFGRILDNYFGLMKAQKRLTWFTAGYNQVSNIFPYVVVSPGYFAGAIQLGTLMQTGSAFGSVQGAFSFFISSYSTLAEWTSVVNRLTGFEAAMEVAKRDDGARAFPHRREAAQEAALALADMDVRLPTGEAIVAVDRLSIGKGERVLVTGPSGGGKTTLFRAIAGIWPFGTGTITLPQDARVMILPQRPYVPVGRLDDALTYPLPATDFDHARLAEALTAVGLEVLVHRLEEQALWPHILSLGEQQRLSIARALLEQPDVLLLDEATAALDEPSEAAVYALLRARLPQATVLSIGHRATLNALHDRTLALSGTGLPRRLVDGPAFQPEAA